MMMAARPAGSAISPTTRCARSTAGAAVARGAEGGAGSQGRGVGSHHTRAGPLGKAREPSARCGCFHVLPAEDEPFLGGLLRHTHAGADLAPRGPRATGLINEVPDEHIG